MIKVRIETTGRGRDRLTLGDTVAHAQHLLEALRALSPHGQKVDFQVIGLSMNSPATLEVVPFNPDAKNPRPLEGVENRIISKLKSIVAGSYEEEMPTYSEILILNIIATASIKLTRENRQMEFALSDGNAIYLGAAVAKRLTKFLNRTTTEMGTIRGHLEVVRNREAGRSFNLFPITGAKQIRCEWADDSLKPEILTYLENRELVEVHGKLFQRLRDRFPSKVIVSSLARLEEDQNLPSIESFRGYLRGQPEPEGGWRSEW